MKGFSVALLWGFMMLLILGITYPVWSWAISQITTAAGGDAFSVLLADAVFVIMCLATLGAIIMYRSNPTIDYRF